VRFSFFERNKTEGNEGIFAAKCILHISSQVAGMGPTSQPWKSQGNVGIFHTNGGGGMPIGFFKGTMPRDRSSNI
jgi:hypothetical protein